METFVCFGCRSYVHFQATFGSFMIFLIEKIILERAGNDLAGKGFIYQLESKTRRFKLGF